MSENERMDRAKRIRQMREGNRNGESEPDDESTDETATESESTPDEQVTTAETAEGDGNAETASTDGGAAAMATKEDEAEETAADTSSETADAAGTSTDDSAGDDPSGTSAPLPDAEHLEEALEESDAEAGAAETVTPDEAAETTEEGEPETEAAADEEEEEETRVLEFSLDGEHYCLEIQYIEEIVKQETITRVPNTPEFVEGVVDLRGQITTILNPKVTIDKENKEAGELIVVFDSEAFEDQGHIGWVVDDVRQVSPILESEVNDPPMGEEYINGVIDRDEDDQFVIWTSPEMAFEDQDSDAELS